MAKKSNGPSPTLLDSGWRGLQAGRWEEARARFEQAAGAEETPEGFEGLSWAAWWLDDAETVFAAREHAYHLYKDAGDGAGAARMAIWLACDQLDFHGAFAVAGGWLGRAQRLLEPLEPGPEHDWLAFFEGFIAHAGGETAKAAEFGRRAAAFGSRYDVPDLEMLGLALEGATLVACAHVQAGMRCLDEATVTALQGEATVPISGAWACCFLVTACTAVRDYERAFEWCDRIAEFAERYGSRYMLAFCRAEYGAVHLWRGRWKQAEAMLEASIDDFARSRPAMVGGPLVGLAELRRRQGRWDEADQLLGRAGPSSTAQLCRARWHWTAGTLPERPSLPSAACARCPRTASSTAPRGSSCSFERARQAGNWRRPARRWRACGRLNAPSARRLSGPPSTSSRGWWRRRAATTIGARSLFEDAIDRFERSGGPFEAAQARIELATTLVALGRSDVAEQEAADSLDQLLELGAAVEAERARRLHMGAVVATTPARSLGNYAT